MNWQYGGSDDIDRAVAYCGELDPGFYSRMQGATQEQIAAIEELLGRPLGSAHHRYLECLGGSAGGLDFGGLDSSAVRLERTLAATYGPSEPGYELFAVGEGEPFEDVYLVERGADCTLERLSTRFGTTHASLAGDAGIIVAGSIAELMCRTMLQQAIVAHMPRRENFALPWTEAAPPEDSEPSLLDQFDRLTARLGLPTLWFSSATTRIAASTTTIAIARQGRRLPFLLSLSSYDDLSFLEAAKTLVEALGLERLSAPVGASRRP